MLYFAFVFGAGFILGSIRLFLVAPRVGERVAELLEMPLMLVVILSTAHWLVHRFLFANTNQRLMVGLLATSLVLLCEVAVVVTLRGLTLREFIYDRDPVSGTAYYISLVIMAIAPLFVLRRDQSNPQP